MKSSGPIAVQSTLQQREAEVYFRRNPEQFMEFFYKSYRLSEDFIERHQDHLSWFELCQSELVEWKEEMIVKFSNRLDWQLVSIQPPVKISESLVSRCAEKWDWHLVTLGWHLNESVWPHVSEIAFKSATFPSLRNNDRDFRGPYPYLPLSIQLIDRFIDQWNWLGLSLSEALPWSTSLIEHYKDRLFWGGEYRSDEENSPLIVVGAFDVDTVNSIEPGGLSDNRKLPWTKKFIEKHEDLWDWWYLSRNTGLPWSAELIECFEDRWDWRNLSANTALPWTVELLAKYEDNWYWKNLSSNTALPWSTTFIQRYVDKWDVERLVSNSEVRWSGDLIAKYSDQLVDLYINWADDGEGGDGFSALSEHENVEWTEVLISQFSDHGCLHILSKNIDIPWSENLIAKHESEWDWYELTKNPSVPWTESLIERYKDQLDWRGLSQNQQLSWAIRLLERFEDKWNWSWLSGNPSLPWSKGLVNRFKDKWAWSSLAQTNLNRPEILQHCSKLMGIEFYQLYYSPTPVFRCSGEHSLSCFNLTRHQVETLVKEVSQVRK
jgi:hypothetical protein